jgi:CelD/BcsL family acetyltransferase involved in cellulose biosynthesis
MSHRIDLLHPRDLDPVDAGAWSELQGTDQAFSSPLLGPQFARAVGAVREDARLAIWREDGKPSGFMAFHRRPSAFARPIGAPFSDLHGLVSAPGAAIGGGALLRAAGLRALKINGLVDPFGLLSSDTQGEARSHRIVLAGDAETYLQRVRAQSRNGTKNFKRYSERLIHDLGELRLSAPDNDRSSLERLFAWKSAQLRASGLHDFLAVDWIGALMNRLFETRQNGFEGLMLNLYAGQRHVAGQFGVRLGRHFHPWIGAMDPQLRPYSPGVIFQWQAIKAMPRLDLTTYELGVGGDHWKRLFSLESLPVRTGLITASSSAGRASDACGRLYDWPAQKLQAVDRFRRRLDHIAATELTLAGRTRGVINALANYDRRNAARHAGAAGG